VFLVTTKPITKAIPGSAGTELTRFNALHHGVSRYTVLPWEHVNEYDGLVASLVAEHPSGSVFSVKHACTAASRNEVSPKPLK